METSKDKCHCVFHLKITKHSTSVDSMQRVYECSYCHFSAISVLFENVKIMKSWERKRSWLGRHEAFKSLAGFSLGQSLTHKNRGSL